MPPLSPRYHFQPSFRSSVVSLKLAFGLPLAGRTPELSTRNVAHFLLGLLTDSKSKDVAAAACAYYSLRNKDGEKLGDFLVRVLDSFEDLTNSPLAQIAFKSRIEVDCNSPRACFTTECTDGADETLFGIQTAQWNDIAVRRSMTISGRSLFYIGLGLHMNDWAGENYIALA